MKPSSVETMIGQVATCNPVLSVEPAVDDVQLAVGGHDGDQGGGGEHTGEQQQQQLLVHDSTPLFLCQLINLTPTHWYSPTLSRAVEYVSVPLLGHFFLLCQADWSQSLFYFVPQESHSQAGSTIRPAESHGPPGLSLRAAPVSLKTAHTVTALSSKLPGLPEMQIKG